VISSEIPEKPEAPVLDLTANGPADFPFSVWSRLQREVMLDYGEALLRPLHHRGCEELRRAIADHLAAFRGMAVDPANIIIGAGTDFLYNLLIQLLGRDLIYALEDPGYGKIRKIYTAGGVRSICVPMDDQGVQPQALGDARVLHISPSHHFPTGLVTPVSRRQALLDWAEKVDGYIIEDDYDSEFRFHAHPMPAMVSLDRTGRVIYMNSFSKSLAPSIRISYMVLPPALMEKFSRELGFYSCTVASFEQYTLARFLSRGWFEKHINRMRRFYRIRRDKVLSALKNCPWADKITVLEENAGLHFLLQINSTLSDEALAELWARAGIRVMPLSRYYQGAQPQRQFPCLLINYSGLDEGQLYRLNQLQKL
jgi:GntR family transcriptional regulator/MocR family aminotransferase